MTIAWLLALYLAVGVICGALQLERSEDRDARAVLHAMVTIAIWPLWAPFVLFAE
jgi:predicted outer membrane lipoprotein